MPLYLVSFAGCKIFGSHFLDYPVALNCRSLYLFNGKKCYLSPGEKCALLIYSLSPVEAMLKLGPSLRALGLLG